MNWEYIAKQTGRYERFTERSDKLDCLYRIASHANLVSLDEQHQIDQVGWTKDLENRVLRWLNANETAIAQAQQSELV